LSPTEMFVHHMVGLFFLTILLTMSTAVTEPPPPLYPFPFVRKLPCFSPDFFFFSVLVVRTLLQVTGVRLPWTADSATVVFCFRFPCVKVSPGCTQALCFFFPFFLHPLLKPQQVEGGTLLPPSLFFFGGPPYAWV